MFLAGTHELTIDAKNRLSVPFAIRRKLSEEFDGHALYVLPGRRSGTLALYPEKHFERLRRNDPADDRLSEDAYEFRQFEYSQCALLEPDGQGRVLLPERLLKRAGIDKDVVLIGVRDHLELWRREQFEQFEQAMWPEYLGRRSRAVQEANSVTSGAVSESSAGEKQ